MRTVLTDGKERVKVQKVTIKGAKGTKEVIEQNARGRTLRRSKKTLKRGEIACIKRCQFIPGLFKDCEKCLNVTRRRLR